VISLFALVAVVVSVSFIGYETREQVKNAALNLKTDIRLAQNQAKTGDKGLVGSNCASTSTLAGWYVNVATAGTSYSVGGICLTPNGVGSCTTAGGCEAYIGTPRTVSLPTGVAISDISYGGVTKPTALIFFRPIEYITTFHAGNPPTFFNDTTGVLSNPLDTTDITFVSSADLVVTLTAADGGSFEVKVTRFGNIEEKKI